MLAFIRSFACACIKELCLLEIKLFSFSYLMLSACSATKIVILLLFLVLSLKFCISLTQSYRRRAIYLRKISRIWKRFQNRRKFSFRHTSSADFHEIFHSNYRVINIICSILMVNSNSNSYSNVAVCDMISRCSIKHMRAFFFLHWMPSVMTFPRNIFYRRHAIKS